MKKIYYLARYYNKTLQNILTSSFIFDDINQIFQLNKFVISIEPRKSKKFYYIFLYILTFGVKPHLNKYHIPWKFKYQTTRVAKKSNFICKISGKRGEKILSYFLFDIFPQLFTAEKQVLHINRNIAKLTIYHFPLVEKSLRFKSKSNYLPRLTIHISINLKYTSIYHKIYLLQLLGLYKNNPSLLPLFDQL